MSCHERNIGPREAFIGTLSADFFLLTFPIDQARNMVNYGTYKMIPDHFDNFDPLAEFLDDDLTIMDYPKCLQDRLETNRKQLSKQTNTKQMISKVLWLSCRA